MAAPGLRAFACVLFIAASFTTRADAPASVFLEDLTSPELAARIRAGATTVIVPIGGTEQNGAHMALGKHNVRVRLLSERIARSLGNAIVAPVIAYVPEGGVNPPTGHMRYPGSITVPPDVYRATIESAARSLKLAGFRDIVLLGDSGDYQRDNVAVAARLDKEWSASPVRVHAIGEYYRAATSEFHDSLRKQGFSDADIGPHAGLADTSLMLAVDPKVVRTDRLQKSEGVTGDPARASAQLGQSAADVVVLQTVAAIRAAAQRK
jgi:creatinine amidohydrolase